MRSAAPRDEQPADWHFMALAQLARKFKGHERAHAMAEERERPIGEGAVAHGDQFVSDHFDERVHPRQRWLIATRRPARELNPPELNVHWQAIRPTAKRRRASAGVRYAQQT